MSAHQARYPDARAENIRRREADLFARNVASRGLSADIPYSPAYPGIGVLL